LVLKKPFDGALAGAERLVVGVHVAGDQVGGFGVGAGDDQGRHAHHVGGEARGDQLGDGFARGHEHLAAHVAALLDGGELVFPVHAGGAGFDHGLHQFEGVEHAAEAGFGVGDDRGEVVEIAFVAGTLALGPLDLVAALEGVVDALDHQRHGVGGVERLVGVHLAGDVGVARDLPAGEVDGLQAGLDLLHGLVAGEGAQGIDEGLVVDQVPQLLGAAAGQGVLDGERAAQADDVLSRVAALDVLPAGVLGPVFFQLGNFEFVVHRNPLRQCVDV
jgi:hypothetical protein